MTAMHTDSHHDRHVAAIAFRMRRRAFQSRNARYAIRLLALADEVPGITFTDPEQVWIALLVPSERNRPMSRRNPAQLRHPTIIRQLATILPPGAWDHQTRLLQDLGLRPGQRAGLVHEIERAWDVTLPQDAADDWETLGDVAESIANALALTHA